jgi:hypothetical protein
MALIDLGDPRTTEATAVRFAARSVCVGHALIRTEYQVPAAARWRVGYGFGGAPTNTLLKPRPSPPAGFFWNSGRFRVRKWKLAT